MTRRRSHICEAKRPLRDLENVFAPSSLHASTLANQLAGRRVSTTETDQSGSDCRCIIHRTASSLPDIIHRMESLSHGIFHRTASISHSNHGRHRTIQFFVKPSPSGHLQSWRRCSHRRLPILRFLIRVGSVRALTASE
jgi:hypothetical protein